MSDRRICIIGAGPSGMSTLWHFVGLGAADDVVCFEKQATWGGLWNYNWKTGVDENGEAVHAGMYKNLWIIAQKEKQEYADYTFEDHFGKLTPSFGPRAVNGRKVQTVHKFGAKTVTLAYRTAPKSASCAIPDTIHEKPNVKYFENSLAFFNDGSSMEFDAVIFTTGYRNHFPFLESRFRVDEGTSFYPAGLYNGTLFFKEGHNNLFYVGVESQIHTFTYFEALAYWTCRFILGQLENEPVTQNDMLKSAEEWHKKANEITSEFDAIRFQARLIEHLVKAADYPYPEICRIEQSLLDLISIRQGERNLVTYKDHSFRSVYTGKMTPPQPKPYMENTDDSLEAYLGKK